MTMEETKKWLEEAIPILLKNRRWMSPYKASQCFYSTYKLQQGLYNIGDFYVNVHGDYGGENIGFVIIEDKV